MTDKSTHLNASPIDALVAMRGIETQFIDAYGNPTTVAEGTKEKILHTMGYAVDDEPRLISQIDEQVRDAWETPLDPVKVLRDAQAQYIALRLPIALVNTPLTLRIELEDGTELTQSLMAIDAELVNAAEVDGFEYQEFAVLIEAPLPHGYHQITLLHDTLTLAAGRLIKAPDACYTPDVIAQGKKIWGLSVQLYCVRSERNWGMGDFTDLQYLLRNAAQQGADFIGLNPIHALYPNNPDACSPYSPSSRKWLNHLYVDVTSVSEYQTDSVQAIVNEPEFLAKLQQARAVGFVDYEAVAALKMPVLNALYSEYSQGDTSALDAFIEQGGESLAALATYDALAEHLAQQGEPAWGWPVFPEAYQSYQSEAVSEFAKTHAVRVRFYAYLQFLADTQFTAASQVASELGLTIGIYRDLAVGVSEGSAEIWAAKDLYVTDASVGAPPDILGPLGQNWGLPPMDPEVMYQQGYQPMIDLFAANMANSGALRIAHAMALLRLWWVIKGDSADKGGYVYYPVDDLLGILALESHRHQTLIIGEDLGTVPEEIREKLADNGVYSYRVFFFEQAEDGGFYSPSHYPVQSMATLTIHDFPTLIGYWHCDDLALGKELGLYKTDEILQPLYVSRHDNKQQILNSLHGHGAISDNISRDVNHVGMTQELNYGMQVHMATGSSALLSLQLEDWLQMDKPVNIPGTFNEYPNWRRKLSQNLEDLFSHQHIQELAQRISAAREQAS